MKTTDLPVEEVVKRLALFNEKAQKLIESEFVSQIREHGLSFQYSASKGQEKSILNAPRQTAIEAFVLNLRFFIQDNERSSFGNIAETYELPQMPDDLKQQFRKIRCALNDTLDSPSNVKIQNLTRRDIVWTIVYGLLAHSNEEKRKIVEKWAKNPFVWNLVNFEFQSCLLDLLHYIRAVTELNSKALAEIAGAGSRVL